MHSTDQLNAALAGRYEIVRQIGAGGMATVYLARDLKHNRSVAVKVLSSELGAVLGTERFLAEIEVTANLHHPHLLPLFDSGEAGGLPFYVMPYIEGETLRARLDRERQIGVEEAVRMVCAIASAVDYAHRHGVIHRDLKPENILLHENEPLVADFGVSLAVSRAGGERMTQTGVSLGTPLYMSPEQAMGDRQIDGRSDIYSLAVMLYEMLTGDTPHTGRSAQAIIARIITDRPPSVRSARDTVPERVDVAVQRALAKLPADRPATAMEFADWLTGARVLTVPRASNEGDDSAPGRRPASHDVVRSSARRVVSYREIAAWVITVAAVALAARSMFIARRGSPATSYGLFPLVLPDSVHMYAGGGPKVAISRDGSQIVFVGERDGRRMLYLRRADDPVARPVRGTDSASHPTFSPSGDWLLFAGEGLSGGRIPLRKVPTAGGAPQQIADSLAGVASWGDDDSLVVIRGVRRIYSMSIDGASQRLVATADSARKIMLYGWPEVLPGSTHVLLTYWRGAISLDSARLGVVSLHDGTLTELGLAGTNPHYVANGYIVFGRAGGLVYAAPFSLSDRKVAGPATLLLDGVAQGRAGATDFAVSNTGTLVYRAGNQPAALVRVGPTGIQSQLPVVPRDFAFPRISPDGGHVAIEMNPAGAPLSDLWMLDVQTNGMKRLISGTERFGQTRSLAWSSESPEWTTDGSRVLYYGDSGFVVSQAWDGSGGASVVNRDRTSAEISLGPPHSYAVLRTLGKTTGFDLRIASMDTLGTLRDFVVTRSKEMNPRVAPNGRMVAYVSDETGRGEVYLRPLPGPGASVQVSLDGGSEPVWSRDGGSLYYRTPVPTIMAARVAATPTPEVLSRRVVFADDFVSGGTHQQFDVFPNGDFLFLRRLTHESEVMVAVDWLRLLKRPQP